MELTASTVQLAMLFLPGLVWAMMDAAHRPPTGNDQFSYLVRIFLFGVASYALVGLVYDRFDRPFDLLDLTAKRWQFASSLDELSWALLASVILATFWISGRTHKVVTRLLNRIGASNHIADQDIWEFMFNSNDPEIKFAFVRDYENELIYSGYVRAFSERLDVRELAIYDAAVYAGNGDLLYETPYLYLSRAPSSITLEFPVAELRSEQTGKSIRQRLSAFCEFFGSVKT